MRAPVYMGLGNHSERVRWLKLCRSCARRSADGFATFVTYYRVMPGANR